MKAVKSPKNYSVVTFASLAAATLIGIFLYGFYLFFIEVPFYPFDPIGSYHRTKNYRADINGQWNNYKNQDLNISFDYPVGWIVELGRYSDCKEGKAVWISSNHARARMIICRAPYITEIPSFSDSRYSEGFVIKEINTPFNKFLSANLDKNKDLSITEKVISEDKSISINIQIPYTSDEGSEIYERDKIFLRILNSIKNYEEAK